MISLSLKNIKDLSIFMIRKNIYIIILIVLSLLPLTWFHKDLIISGGDFGFPLMINDYYVKDHFSVWYKELGMGVSNTRSISVLPFMLIIWLFSKIGISLQIIEKIIFFLLFLFSGLGTYFLTSSLFKNKKASFYAALFYLFSGAGLVFYWHWLNGMIYFYAHLPIMCFFAVKFISTRSIKWLFAFCIMSFFNGLSYANPVLLPIFWVTIFIFIFLGSLENNYKKTLKKVFIGTIVLFISWLFINAYWLTPLFATIKDEFEGLKATVSYTPYESLVIWSTKSSFLNNLRQIDNYWTFGRKYGPDDYYSYYNYYNSWPMVLLSFLPVFFIFYSFLIKKSDKNFTRTIFLGVFYLITLFLSTGSFYKLGLFFYKTIYTYFPLTQAYRAPIEKLAVLISLFSAILGGIGLSLFLKNKPRFIMIIFLILIFFVLPFPYWNGEIIHDGGQIFPSFRVKIPNYYNDLQNYINNQKESYRIIDFPIPTTHNIAYKWEHGYVGADPKLQFLNKGSATPCISDLCLDLLINLETNSPKKEQANEILLSNTLSVINVKYLLFNNDYNYEYEFKRKNKDFYKNIIKNSDLVFEKSIGEVDIYRNNNYLKHIFLSNKLDVLKNNNVLGAKIENDKTIVFPKDAKNIDKEKFSYSALPELISQKINPSKYIIEIKEANNPYILNFLESFNDKWRVYISKDGENIKIDNKRHFKSFGYANSWVINERGDYEIIIYYEPQKYLIFGSIISLITFLILIAATFYLIFKKINYSKNA